MKNRIMQNSMAITAIFLISASMALAQRYNNSQPQSPSFLNRFGYQFSLYNLGRFDSNILRLRSNSYDLAGGLYPSLAIEYPFSLSTKMIGKYSFGINQFASTSFLNTTSHWGLLLLSHQYSKQLEIDLYGLFNRSNQPDVLNTRSVYTFASYTQDGEGVRLKWKKDSTTMIAFEYSVQHRNYSGIFIDRYTRQKDNLYSAGLSWSHLFSPKTLGYLRAAYQFSASNNARYRFSEPVLDLYVAQEIGHGIQLQFLNKLSSLWFYERPVSINMAISRKDLISTFMIGMEKKIGGSVALNARYYFQKDFSNEPLRKFTDHTLSLGLQFALGRSPSLDYLEEKDVLASSEIHPEMNKQLTAVRLTNLGYTYLLKREYDKSLQYSLQALSIDPDVEEAHINAGIAYYKKGMLTEAIQEWSSATSLNPNNHRVQALLEKAKAER